MSYNTTTTSFPGPGNQGVQVGHNSGFIETRIYTPERPETPPQPSCVVPLPRDRDFVTRGSLLDQIREKCTEPAARVALVGLGGVGKSQLAVEYCYRIEEQSPETWVFWVRATNSSRLDQDFRDIAERTKIRGRNDPKADVYKLVHDWLRDAKNGPWLLVIDNADDAGVFHPAPGKGQSSTASEDSCDGQSVLKQHLLSYLPTSKHGSILVTSRTRRAAMEVVEDDNIISIEPMDDRTACALIRKKLRNNTHVDSDIAELAAALDHMPLALVHAASYIREGGARCSVRKFLDDYLQDDRRKAYLLEQKASHIRAGTANHNILKAWQISFKYLRDKEPSAADLLSLMSFFDRQGIHESLLHPVESTNADPTPMNKIRDDFEHDIRTLRDFSFITFTNDPSTFEMHSLVQLAMREWLENSQQVEKWKDRFIACLYAHFPSPDYETLETCTALFPHAKRALKQRPKSHVHLEKWADLLLRVVSYICKLGQFGESIEIIMQWTEATKELLGEDSQQVLWGWLQTADLMVFKGRGKEAEMTFLNVLQKLEKLTAIEPLVTLRLKSKIARGYRRLGMLKEAEKLAREALQEGQEVLSIEHPAILSLHFLLSEISFNQGKLKEAEELRLHVIQTRSRVLGSENVDTLRGMDSVAAILAARGKLEDAESMHRQILVIRERVLGREHPTTLHGMQQIAILLEEQGKFKEAEPIRRRIVAQYQAIYGDESIHTLSSMMGLACTLLKPNFNHECLGLVEKAYTSASTLLGERHHLTLKLHRIYSELNKYCEQHEDHGGFVVEKAAGTSTEARN